jgi:hypothetical protein
MVVSPAEVSVGKMFTFSKVEEGELQRVTDRLVTAVSSKPYGWRVMVVQDSLRLFKLTRAACYRSQSS